MLISLKIPVSLNAKDYSKGTHTVPDELSKHWFFQALVKDGSAKILEIAPDPILTEIEEANSAALDSEFEDDLGLDLEEEKPKGKKKKKR